MQKLKYIKPLETTGERLLYFIDKIDTISSEKLY